ncbi:MAG TPA: TolC family protein [Gemmatimonadaceae bacterium]
MIDLPLRAMVASLLLATAARDGAQRCAPATIPAPAGAAVTVSLDDAIANARRQASLVRHGQAELARRRADAHVARAALLPTLDARADLVDRSYNRAQQGLGPLPGASTPVVGPFGNQDYRVEARIVATPFAAWRRAAASSVEERAAEAALSASRGDAAYAAARAYARLARATAECSARMDELALARRLLDVVRARVRLGASPRADSLRAAAQVAAAEGAVARAAFLGDSARAALAIAIGLPVGAPIVPADSLATLAALPSDTGVALAAAEHSRGEMAALAEGERAARLRVRAAAATGLPFVTVSANAGENGPGLGDLRATSGVAVGITIPVFDGGLARARVEARRADQAEVTSAMRAARDAIATEWADARSRIRGAAALVASARAMASLAAAELADTEARYRGGDVGSLELLAASRATVRARDALIDARSEAAAARLQWMHAIGRFDDDTARIAARADAGASPSRQPHLDTKHSR